MTLLADEEEGIRRRKARRIEMAGKVASKSDQFMKSPLVVWVSPS